MTATKRRFVEVEERRVHYRRAGAGPPLVMLHGSPGNSAMLAHEMSAATAHFTCFAIDTPGFGGSDPLPGDSLSVRDLAQATAAAMVALGLPPCPVYGTHTGALIAIELGVGWPERATGLVLEGLPIFTDEEIAAIFSPAYFAPLVTDALGGHLTSTWMRFRDQFTWFPWLARDNARLNSVDRPPPDDIQLWVEMYYRSCRTYGPAYRAACYHGRRSHEAAEALTLPAIFMASAEDMLFPHLDRLPVLRPGLRAQALPYDPEAKYRAIVAFARSLPPAPGDAPAASLAPVGCDPAVQMVDTPHGQVFVRCYGDRAATPLILLHDAPGSGLGLEERARELAARYHVLLPDLPGTGDSDDPAIADILAASATAVGAIIRTFALDSVVLAATGSGCAVASLLCRDERVAEIVLENAPVPNPEVAAAVAPDLPLTPEGSHWITAWLMVRDGQIYDPWFAGTVTAQRGTQGRFDADWLHAQTCEIVKARTSYHRLPRAAWLFDAAPSLAAATVPVRAAPLSSLIGDQP